MTFNPLKEKGISIEKQLKTWQEIAKRPYNKAFVDCYTRCRQIFMNGIEVEACIFKRNLSRMLDDVEANKIVSGLRRIDDMHQTTANWLIPYSQSVLESTLAYEQIAVDLTSWLAQNEPDDYVRETFNFGLLEDFDHLYRYAQWYYMTEGELPDNILQGQTDVFPGRPTQHHHNPSEIRLRKPYNKQTASPQTKVNILTLVSAEQQTRNFYAEHGFMYGNDVLRRTYAEIKDVEEEHVSMYETLIDPTETMWEKLVIHEFCEVCNYYNCMKDETDDRLKSIWEEFMMQEIEHLHIANKLLQKYEKRDAEEIIGDRVYEPSTFKTQKEYVQNILENEADKRLDGTDKMGYTTINKLPDDWAGYDFQETVNADGAPSEQTIILIQENIGYDLTTANEALQKKEVKILEKGLQKVVQAPNTVQPKEYKGM